MNVLWTTENATGVSVFHIDSNGVPTFLARGDTSGAVAVSIPCDGTVQRLSFTPFRDTKSKPTSVDGKEYSVFVIEYPY